MTLLRPSLPASVPCDFSGAGGLRLAAESWSAGSGRPILLAHGFGQTRQSWAGSQSVLAEAGYPGLSWDMRGHGQSERNSPELRYQAEQFVGDVVAAARTLGDQPVLVGASMGGLTGLMAQATQRLFSALVLVDVTPHWEPAGLARIRSFMTGHPEGFDSFEHAAESIAGYLPHRRERKTPKQLSALLRADADGRLRWHWDPRLLEEFVQGSEHLQERIATAARDLDIPVLLISGGRSDLVSDRTVGQFLQLVPHARHVRLPNATHMLAGDDNDAFSRTLLDFLGAQFPSNPAAKATTASGAVP